eukprot:7389119-Prymnesium_polylepis.2
MWLCSARLHADLPPLGSWRDTVPHGARGRASAGAHAHPARLCHVVQRAGDPMPRQPRAGGRGAARGDAPGRRRRVPQRRASSGCLLPHRRHGQPQPARPRQPAQPHFCNRRPRRSNRRQASLRASLSPREGQRCATARAAVGGRPGHAPERLGERR